jgi:hypothetical protein
MISRPSLLPQHKTMNIKKLYLGARFVQRCGVTILAGAALSGFAASTGGSLPFPDFGFLPSPADYHGDVFKLSQNYPTSKPGPDKLPDFFKKFPPKPSPDFAVWREYMMAIRDYCFEGNVEVDWRVEGNKARSWYHIPWQHYGPAGREGIHGLTKEAPVKPGQLGPNQGRPNPNDYYQTYAVGFFNEFGGYTIGQVWTDHMNPNPGVTSEPGGFLNGTTISKLLFVDVPSNQVDSLANPQQWQAYIQAGYFNATRSVRTVSLIQMDIAVRDERAPLGWVFGTFQYNGALSNSVRWKNLVPVGVVWGNDPMITNDAYSNPTPTNTKINPTLNETAINADTHELPPTHLGWNGRLNGPVDNPRSSCLSCHMTAETPAYTAQSPLFLANPPAIGSQAWMHWFQNIKCSQPFDRGANSADFSLQLSLGLANFEQSKAPAQSGLFAKDYLTTVIAPAAAASYTKGMSVPNRPVQRRVYPIVRDMTPSEVEKQP